MTKVHKLIPDLEPEYLNQPQIEAALYRTTKLYKVNEKNVIRKIKSFDKAVDFPFDHAYFCLFVFGFHSATAVSLIGLKMIDPSCGLSAKPIPCDDFLPTKRMGNSAPKGNGPARNALVFIENSLNLAKQNN